MYEIQTGYRRVSVALSRSIFEFTNSYFVSKHKTSPLTCCSLVSHISNQSDSLNHARFGIVGDGVMN
jgi:hypothetical protein